MMSPYSSIQEIKALDRSEHSRHLALVGRQPMCSGIDLEFVFRKLRKRSTCEIELSGGARCADLQAQSPL